MKKTLIAIVACLFAFGGTAVAQKNIKLGHINSNDLMQIMPGRDASQRSMPGRERDIQPRNFKK